MPQMPALSWLVLLLTFTLIYMLFMSLNYFMFNYATKYNPVSKILKNNSWKW